MILRPYERELVCNGCDEVIIVGGCHEDLDASTFRGVACGCRQPVSSEPLPDNDITRALAAVQAKQPPSLVPIPTRNEL